MLYEYTTPIEFLKWFILEEPYIVNQMKETDHYYDDQSINPFHIENSTLSHTLMVYKEAMNRNVDKLVQISTLLHDIGKPLARQVDEEKKKVRFNGHEGYSFHLANRILNKINLTNEEKTYILSIISLHGSFYQHGKKTRNYWSKKDIPLLEKLIQHIECDHNGRITDIDDGDEFMGNIIKFKNDIINAEDKIEMKKTRTIKLLVGVPNAGKSSYLNNYMWSNDETIISRDDILMETAPMDNYNEAWDYATITNKHKAIDKELQRRFSKAIKENKDIVIDMTNISRKARNRWLASVPKHYKKEAVIFTTSYEEIIERNENRENKKLNIDIIHNMMSGFMIPTYGEFDNILWHWR